MYAVIETGGKQYRVELGTELEVELLDAPPGGSVTLDRVLLVADGDSASIGRPLVANATVAAEVIRQARGEKVVSFKYRPKARRRVKKGHRQELTVLRISDIVVDGRSAAASAAKVADDRKTERQRLEEAARRQAEADAALAAQLAKAAAPVPTEPAAPPAKAKSGRRPKAATPPTATPPTATPPTATPPRSPARGRAKPPVDGPSEAAAPAPEPASAETKPKRSRTTKKDE
jgi:large subunit ribosomal protein L21